jgi:hypothetical protein
MLVKVAQNIWVEHTEVLSVIVLDTSVEIRLRSLLQGFNIPCESVPKAQAAAELIVEVVNDPVHP